MSVATWLFGDSAGLAVYTVHEPPNPAFDRMQRAEELEFVRDGFSWGDALVPPLWLSLRGEWIVLAGYLAVALALVGVLAALGAHQDWSALAVLALNILFGFEASQLRRWVLRLKGWREIGTVSGRTRDDCERRFFDAWLPEQPVGGSHAFGRPEVRSLAGGVLQTRAREWMERARGLIERKT